MQTLLASVGAMQTLLRDPRLSKCLHWKGIVQGWVLAASGHERQQAAVHAEQMLTYPCAICKFANARALLLTGVSAPSLYTGKSLSDRQEQKFIMCH